MSSQGKTPRTLQQQPQQHSQAQQHQQQQSGSGGFQSRRPAASGQQMGEGSYEGSRDYKDRTEKYLKTHDVEKDAAAAKPRSDQEAREMKEAEEEGRSHSKGER